MAFTARLRRAGSPDPHEEEGTLVTRVQILLPPCPGKSSLPLCQRAVECALQARRRYTARGPLHALLAPPFLETYIQSGDVAFASPRGAAPGAVFLGTDGALAICCDRSTMERLGLGQVGCGRKRSRGSSEACVVHIDVRRATFGPGDATYEKVQRMLGQDRLEPVELIVSTSSETIRFPDGFEARPAPCTEDGVHVLAMDDSRESSESFLLPVVAPEWILPLFANGDDDLREHSRELLQEVDSFLALLHTAHNLITPQSSTTLDSGARGSCSLAVLEPTRRLLFGSLPARRVNHAASSADVSGPVGRHALRAVVEVLREAVDANRVPWASLVTTLVRPDDLPTACANERGAFGRHLVRLLLPGARALLLSSTGRGV